MDRDALTDAQWERLRELVPGGAKGRRGPRSRNRLFLDALLWLARSGGCWKDLPERFGDFQTVKRRYYRWIEMGVRCFHHKVVKYFTAHQPMENDHGLSKSFLVARSIGKCPIHLHLTGCKSGNGLCSTRPIFPNATA